MSIIHDTPSITSFSSLSDNYSVHKFLDTYNRRDKSCKKLWHSNCSTNMFNLYIFFSIPDENNLEIAKPNSKPKNSTCKSNIETEYSYDFLKKL